MTPHEHTNKVSIKAPKQMAAFPRAAYKLQTKRHPHLSITDCNNKNYNFNLFMALWNELAVSPLRTSSYTASLQGFGGYSRYVSEEMTNSLDTLSTALLSETLLFSAIEKCTSLNCTDNISWSLCSCYRSHIYTSFLALSTTYFKIWNCLFLNVHISRHSFHKFL